MPDSPSINNDFLDKLTGIIEDNISNEQFGVSELARETGMSRSNLLRKVKKSSKISVSQFIRQVRLKRAMEMLKQTSLNVSEVSYKVGFGSTSYFIKCFHDYYGYPPGEVGNRDSDDTDSDLNTIPKKKRWIVIPGITLSLSLIVIVLFIFINPFSYNRSRTDKSIAVLPFINDSYDSSNIHIINGLMESTLDNLQKISDLRVISRTSVEKFRNNIKTAPEIARELNVKYLVEGSGQKIGDQILLNIQLIQGISDEHLWSKQYSREAKDIFKLQMEVAKDIADEIEAIITPEEKERIEKIPTENLVAYDYFLKGIDLFYKGSRESLEEAITYFEKAVEHDNKFARAYADLAISYSFLDIYQVEKQYSEKISNYADKALLFDPKLPQSLIAKGFSYMVGEKYELALPYLEKALEYNSNSALVINALSDFYARFVPDTEKYLEYALKGIQLDIAAQDSVDASFIYLHVSNALMQSGLVNEAEKYINKSLEYDPENLYTELLRAYIPFARNRDLEQTKERLIKALNRDSSSYDINKEIGMICYYMRDYENAYTYFKKITEIRNAQNLDIDRGENAKIGVVLSEIGLAEESDNYFNDFLDFAENDNSIYKNLSLAVYYSYKGDTEKAIDNMKLFSEQENYPYWYILFIGIDPLFDNIKDTPEFRKILNDLEVKFRNRQKKIKASLEAKDLL